MNFVAAWMLGAAVSLTPVKTSERWDWAKITTVHPLASNFDVEWLEYPAGQKLVRVNYAGKVALLQRVW